MKYLIILIIFVININASVLDIFEDINIYENNEYRSLKYKTSKDESKLEFLIKLRKEYEKRKVKEFTVFYNINKLILGNNTSYLTIVSDDTSLVSSNVKLEKINNILVAKIDSKTKNKIYFKYKYNNLKRIEYRSKLITPFEYKYLLNNEGILYGISYGIIFCAFFYYLLIYMTTFEKTFLYYSLMQLSVLLTLISFTYLSYKSYPTYTAQLYTDVFETASFLFTLLFAKSVLQVKEKMSYLNLVFNLFIFAHILDVIYTFIEGTSLLYEYLPFYSSFLLSLLASFISIYKKNYYAIIYAIAWSVIMIFIYIASKDILPFSSIYIIHFATPLESLILSLALALSLKQIVKDKNEKEKLLIHKSKLASMGEMINNIAHQWRQPLMHLSYINMNLQLSSDDDDLDKKYLNEKIRESNSQLEFMSKTIDDFKDFYKPTKEKENFLVSSAVQKAIDIMKPILKDKNINLKLEIQEDKEINSYENEYSQVVLNLITNSKDALVLKEIKDANIVIKVSSNNNKSLTEICDNAGGIPINSLDKIFEPYFTTKHTGTGIGLYMSKTIIQSHFKGTLAVKNTKEGACFSIKV